MKQSFAISALFLTALMMKTWPALAQPAPSAPPASALCENLSRFSCSPGSFDDGTGVVKSGSEIEDEIATIQKKHKASIKKQVTETLRNPNNSYFKEINLAALGLKNSPDCVSEEKNRQAECEKRAVEGLSRWVERGALGAVHPQATITNSRVGNLQEQSYLVGNKTYKDLVEKVEKQVSQDISNPKMEKKIEDKIFPQVKALILEKIKGLSISDAQKKTMLKKVSAIQFNGTNCSDLTGSSAGIDGLLLPNAVYNSTAGTFKYCNGYLMQLNSEFAITRTIAHEIAHSIDPCCLTVGPTDMSLRYSDNNNEIKARSEYPIPNIISCLRSPHSTSAKLPLTTQQSEPLPANPPPPSAAVFCKDGDQIGEAFADWMASEVTPIYIEKNFKLTTEQYQIGYSNSFRAICNVQQNTNSGNSARQDEHPDLERRIDHVILVQPRIREQMKCPPRHSKNIYCDPNVAFDDGSTNQNLQPGGGIMSGGLGGPMPSAPNGNPGGGYRPPNGVK